MKRFCRENPVERIGYQKDGVADIKKHRWFQVNRIFTLFSVLLAIGTPHPVSGKIRIYFV